jgi:topoisomerase-4 subunit A
MLEDGYYLEIYKAEQEEVEVKQQPKIEKPIIKKEIDKPAKVIEEAIVTKDERKIRVSRLDLFDDEE